MLNIEKTEDIKEFIGLPFKLYKGNPYYVPELKMETKALFAKDPFWQNARRQFFIAKQDGEAVGRAAAIINKTHNDYWGDKTGFFGFFECADNRAAAAALLDAAGAWLKERGMQSMRGPLNPGTNHTCAVLLDNFDKMPCIMMPYNPPFYDALILGAGLKKAKDLLAFERAYHDSFTLRMEKIMQRILKNPAVKMREINLKNLGPEIEIIRRIYNAAWAQNWGFVPITEAEIQNTAAQLKLIARPELTCMIEYAGRPAGFAISVPNMNRVLKILNGSLNPLKIPAALIKWKTLKDCRMLMLGVHPDFRGKGLELLLIRNMVCQGIAKGWRSSELSWILEDNKAIISVMEEAGCRKTKSYRIYEKDL